MALSDSSRSVTYRQEQVTPSQYSVTNSNLGGIESLLGALGPFLLDHDSAVTDIYYLIFRFILQPAFLE